MLFSIIAQLALVAVGAVAQEPCDPGTPPPSSTSSSGPTPTGGTSGVTTLKNHGKCMDVNAANYADGTKVQIYDCNGSGAQQWSMQRGDGKVKVNGKNLCLDAGLNPKDGSLVKIWTCYANTPQQQWYYTNDNRLALTGKGLCLDLPSGNTANGQQLQVWSCANGNPNQEWTSTLKAGMRRRRYARAQIADQLA